MSKTDTTLTPRQIVEQLNQHIVGQANAKRAVAIAIRNRWRRQQLSDELRQEVSPKNILMIGSTGVGKTEIARRLAKLTNAPFIKVEATKYTEVGYYGRDVESMIRELLDNSLGIVREQQRETVKADAQRRTNDRLVEMLCPAPTVSFPDDEDTSDAKESLERTREKMKAMLIAGDLEEREVNLTCLLYTSPSPRDLSTSRMPSSA